MRAQWFSSPFSWPMRQVQVLLQIAGWGRLCAAGRKTSKSSATAWQAQHWCQM